MAMPSLALEMDVYGKQYTAREDRNTKQYQKKLQMNYKKEVKRETVGSIGFSKSQANFI